jgi:hypothetical protein
MESKRLGKLLGIFMTALTAIAIGAPFARAEAPAPKYRQFAGCPSLKTENPETSTCLRLFIPGGRLRLGKKEVPLSNPLSFGGGINSSAEGLSYSPLGGLLPVKELVPGGLNLAGLSIKLNTPLSMVIELAGSVELLSFEGMRLPVKIHLLNSALSDGCYIGSNADPINLDLITGTTSPSPPTKPITGKSPIYTFDPAAEILTGTGGIYVGNSFAVPGATGCVLKPFGSGFSINGNGAINSTMGLPARAGASETRLNYNLEVVETALVYP